MNKNIAAFVAAIFTGLILTITIGLVAFFVRYPISIVVIVIIMFGVSIFKSTYKAIIDDLKK